LSFDLTQVNADGSVTTRYELTPVEREAIEYARQNGVLLVVSAGNDGGVMSALGQASQEFENIITVGASEQTDYDLTLADSTERSDYSSYGSGLDILATGGKVDLPEVSTVGDSLGVMTGTSVATAKVTGATSQVWAANPDLSYRQVIEILKATATDLNTPGHDLETGAGLLNVAAAIQVARTVSPETYTPAQLLIPKTWSGEDTVIPMERAVAERFSANGLYYNWVPYEIQPGDTLSAIALERLGGSTPEYYQWIADHNGIANSDLIFAGDVIEVPQEVAAPPAPAEPPISSSVEPIAAAAIAQLYQSQQAQLGTPTSEITDLGNGFLKQNFIGGYIIWNGQQAVSY